MVFLHCGCQCQCHHAPYVTAKDLQAPFTVHQIEKNSSQTSRSIYTGVNPGQNLLQKIYYSEIWWFQISLTWSNYKCKVEENSFAKWRKTVLHLMNTCINTCAAWPKHLEQCGQNMETYTHRTKSKIKWMKNEQERPLGQRKTPPANKHLFVTSRWS